MNIDNYSTEDLLEILNLNEISNNEPSEFQIKESTDSIIARMRQQLNFDLVNFFEKVKTRLLKELGDNVSDDEPDTSNTQISNWYENQYPEQNNLQQMDKATNKTQTVQTFNSSSQFPMTRERLGIPTTHPVPVAQGTMNPMLKNITTRMVYIDSQYRQNIYTTDGNGSPIVGGPAFNTDFTLDLTDSLTNVISLKLYSFSIPLTWYAFSAERGNICFDISNVGLSTGWNSYKIPSGNYNTLLDLAQAFSTVVNDKVGPMIVDVSNNGIANFTTPTDAIDIRFWSEDQEPCIPTCYYGRTYRNQNLAWNLGFRQPATSQTDGSGMELIINFPSGTPVYADVPGNVYGSTHFFLAIDDYNQNHLNKGLVGINSTQIKLPVPSYFSPANKNITGQSLVSCTTDISGTNQYVKTLQTHKGSPRKLTQAQIYTANEILASQTAQKDRAYSPTMTDVLAIIPLKSASTGNIAERSPPLIEYSNSLQMNQRTYFGPVNIERMRVRLLDDRGNLVNLNDNDWSFSLIVDQLYQY